MRDPAPGDPTSLGAVPATKTFKPDNVKAMSWLLISVVASSAMTVAVREISFDLDPRMIVMLRFGITAPILILALIVSAQLRRTLTFSEPLLHVIRGICMGISTHLGFYAIANIPLVTVTVLFFMVPIFATAIAGLINSERAGPRRLIAIAVSFIGVLLILKPGFVVIEPAIFAALASSILFALALILSRRVAQADGAFSALFSSVMITLVISVPLAIPVWQMPETGAVWWIVAILVATGLIRLLADIQAYRIGEASVLAPITYLRLILIGGSAYVLYDEIPDLWAAIGALIIIASALYITRREAQLRRQNSTEAK